jgi:hypothetical protein
MAGGKREKYAFESAGDCLGELIPPGTVLVAEPGEEIGPRDLVMLVFDVSGPGVWAEFGKTIAAEGHDGICKIFLGAYQVGSETFGSFGQLNPPAAMPIPMNALLSVDRVAFYGEPTGHDREAMAMLEPFIITPRIEQKEAA